MRSIPTILCAIPRSGASLLQAESFSKTRRGSVAPLTGDIAGFWCVESHFEISTETLLDGMEPSRTLKIASAQRKPYSEVSFISVKGSALPTWEVGPSTQLDSNTGPPSCFGSMVL